MPRAPLASDLSRACAALGWGLALVAGLASLLSTQDLPREWSLWLVWPLLLAAVVLVHVGLALAVGGRALARSQVVVRWSVAPNLAGVLVVWGLAAAWWAWAIVTGY